MDGVPGWIVGYIGYSSALGGAGMGPRRVELFAAIRYDWQRNQMPVRALARKYDVHRRTVRQAIASPVPPDRKTPERAAMVLDGVRELIDGMLREDLTAPRKQRHTARRVFERLCDEHGAQVSYSYVAKYVARRRGEIAAQDRARDGGVAGFVPQAKEPGAEVSIPAFPNAQSESFRTVGRRPRSGRRLGVCPGFTSFVCVLVGSLPSSCRAARARCCQRSFLVTSSVMVTGSSQCGQFPPIPAAVVNVWQSWQRWVPSARAPQVPHS